MSVNGYDYNKTLIWLLINLNISVNGIDYNHTQI